MEWSGGGKVVFEGLPAAAERLAARDAGVRSISRSEAFRPFSAWGEMGAILKLPPTKLSAVLFAHSRWTPSGTPRLVVVEMEAYPDIEATVVAPATLLHSPRALYSGSPFLRERSIIRRLDEAGMYLGGPRFLGGEIDPTDRSHFVLRLIVRNRPVRVDGWLRDDDTVRITVNEADLDIALSALGDEIKGEAAR